MKQRSRLDGVPDKKSAPRLRALVLFISVPLLLFAFVLLALPKSRLGDPGNIKDHGRGSGESLEAFDRTSLSGGISDGSLPGGRTYAVIFDAGSSGSRVHVYCFSGRKLELVPLGDDMELFRQVKRYPLFPIICVCMFFFFQIKKNPFDMQKCI
jgi:apyrase